MTWAELPAGATARISTGVFKFSDGWHVVVRLVMVGEEPQLLMSEDAFASQEECELVAVELAKSVRENAAERFIARSPEQLSQEN